MKWVSWAAPILAATSAIWCAVIGWRMWFTPVRYLVVGGVAGPALDHKFFSDVSGFGALPLIVPVLIAIVATYAALRGLLQVLALLMVLFAVFAFITGFSIGGAFLPAAALLLATVLAFVVSSKHERKSVDG